ncbi:class 1 fructose-bisphosphatase [Candidatus Nanohalococcus occultus]|uniref:fructose-bisphosphatase n=1 Tax=Candidatus Nanohalococcus occultus TaxID=2978047 RepID=A0ABY8CFC1_9ARCH|nr:Fructose-1,6-bisphosphatase [Candidatus Nanohaloarchaeota archaeon SVXNc]
MSHETAGKIFQAVVETAPHISSGMLHRREYVGEENPSDEKQFEADIWANEMIKEKITEIEEVGEFASEEEKHITDCGEGVSVAVDPLDGSSNIPTNNIVGTIVGVYDSKLPASGKNLIEAFYVVYGPITSIIRSDGKRVDEYVIETDKDDAEAVLVAEGLSMPEPTVYGFGGNKGWKDPFDSLEDSLNDDLKLRYGGALVGDVNQVLHHGGVFGYPAKESAPDGKLRLQFEAIPIGFIFETMSSGASTDGEKSLTSIEPVEIHQRTPVFIGNAGMLDRIEEQL